MQRMNVFTAGILSVAVMAAIWLPVCVVLYVLSERQFTLRAMLASTMIIAASIGLLTIAHRMVHRPNVNHAP
jgi:hypothetical protein